MAGRGSRCHGIIFLYFSSIIVVEGLTKTYGYSASLIRRTRQHLDIIMEVVQTRDAATLPLIQAHVAPGTVVHSDQWRAYNRVANLPAVSAHQTVNHSVNFVIMRSKSYSSKSGNAHPSIKQILHTGH